MSEQTRVGSDEPELGYEAAIAELERIVTDLQNDEVGVDELAERVARGARLVELCRDRLHRAELAVDEVVDALRAAAAEDGSTGAPGTAASDDHSRSPSDTSTPRPG